MASKIIKSGKMCFRCDECGFVYAEKIFAEKCEQFCKNNNACSVEITKHAVQE